MSTEKLCKNKGELLSNSTPKILSAEEDSSKKIKGFRKLPSLFTEENIKLGMDQLFS